MTPHLLLRKCTAARRATGSRRRSESLDSLARRDSGDAVPSQTTPGGCSLGPGVLGRRTRTGHDIDRNRLRRRDLTAPFRGSQGRSSNRRISWSVAVRTARSCVADAYFCGPTAAACGAFPCRDSWRRIVGCTSGCPTVTSGDQARRVPWATISSSIHEANCTSWAACVSPLPRARGATSRAYLTVEAAGGSRRPYPVAGCTSHDTRRDLRHGSSASWTTWRRHPRCSCAELSARIGRPERDHPATALRRGRPSSPVTPNHEAFGEHGTLVAVIDLAFVEYEVGVESRRRPPPHGSSGNGDATSAIRRPGGRGVVDAALDRDDLSDTDRAHRDPSSPSHRARVERMRRHFMSPGVGRKRHKVTPRVESEVRRCGWR